MNRTTHLRNAAVRAATITVYLAVIFFFLLSAPVWAKDAVHVVNLGRPYRVNFDGGPVTLKIVGANTASVRMTETDIPENEQVKYSVSAGVLSITVTTETTDGPTTDPGLITLRLPRFEFVYATNSSGEIDVDNMSTEHLTLTTTSGPISVTGTNAVFNTKSDTGSQSFRHVYGAINATTNSAPVTVDHEVGLVHLQTASGAIRGTSILLQTTSSFRTTSGDITISLWNKLHDCSFDLKSQSGVLRLGQIKSTGEITWGHGQVPITAVSTTGAIDIQ